MIDVIEEINAAHRAVRRCVLETGHGHAVAIERTYNAPVEEVWDACTNPVRLPRWFLPLSGELSPGGHYQLEGNAGGTIQQCDPPTRLAVTWEYDSEISWIGLQLWPVGDARTRLELTHSVPDDEKWAEFGPGAVGPGWDLSLVGLGAHLVAGKGSQRVDPSWASSEEGDRFTRMSSAEWQDAHIAAGADPEAARAAADRTSEFWCRPAPESVTHIGKPSR